MSRPRLSPLRFALTSVIVSFCACVAAVLTAEAATSADSGWQSSSREVPELEETANQWTPSRPQVQRPANDVAPVDEDDSQENAEPLRKPKPKAEPPAANAKPVPVRRAMQSSATQPATGNSNSQWQLPNQAQEQKARSAAPTSQSTVKNRAANQTPTPSRSAGQPPREPRSFNPPAGAQRLASGTAGQPNVRNTPQPQRQLPNRRIAHQPKLVGQKASDYTSRMWQTINVAFQAPSEWESSEAEGLPAPGGVMYENGGPMMHGGEGVGGCNGGTCDCYGGPGACGPGCCGPECGAGCGDCGCGDCCSPCGDGMCSGGPDCGCACEPGCGCPSNGNCDDLFCLGVGDDESCHTIRVRVPKWQEMMILGGVQGFKGPYDQHRDSGNFGFHEGFNAGFKVPFTSMGYQIGYQAVQSQLNGDQNTNTGGAHTQQFVTAALFQRAKDGIQMGLAWDMLRDERWGAVDFHQLRGELSFVDRGCHELGVSITTHLDNHEFVTTTEELITTTVFQASDQYLLFYRFHGCRGGEGRFYAGFNDDSDGIVGADMLLPLQDRWSLQGGFTYLIPDAPSGSEGAREEAWNIGLGMVFHWDCRARRCHSNCYRPLFNVADNGYMIIDDRPGRVVQIED